MHSAIECLRSGVFVDGEWVDAPTGGHMEHVSPSTGRVQRRFAVAGPEEVKAAVAAARAALDGWRAMPGPERRRILLRIAAALRADSDRFALISGLEAGLILPTARLQPTIAADWFEYYAGWSDKVSGESFALPGVVDYTVAEPIGVAALLHTWNGPTVSLAMKAAPALAAGCAVVIKPPDHAPFSAAEFARVCSDAGVPPGVVNVVPGGADTGQALVADAGVDRVSFTGSRTTAARIQEAGGNRLTPPVFELGGKSANLVFADADLARAAKHTAARIIGMTGQTCVAPTRLLVEAPAYEPMVAAVVERLAAVRIGDPFCGETMMGPVVSATAQARIDATVRAAAADGSGRIVLGAERRPDLPDELRGGFYVTPAVFRDVDNASPLAREEIFGPVLAIMAFRDEEEAVALANDTDYGLAAFIQTADVARAHRLSLRLEAGNVAVNGGAPMAAPLAPFGGFRASGYGKEGGLAGLLEFVRIKNVSINIAS
jgi:aldehyde dehydrogenase (NAD+)